MRECPERNCAGAPPYFQVMPPPLFTGVQPTFSWAPANSQWETFDGNYDLLTWRSGKATKA